MKKTAAFILIAIILCCALLAACNNGDENGNPADIPEPSEDIVVITYNVRALMLTADVQDQWVKRRESLIKHIRGYMPDLLGTQEVRDVQLTYIMELLPEYASVGAQGTFIIYKTSRFELLDSGYFWLSETPNAKSKGWDAESYRVVTYAKLKDLVTGKELYHYNTHLDNAGSLARKNGMRFILDLIEENATPSVMTGDFNVNEDDSNYKIAAEELSDTKYIAEDTMLNIGTFHGYGKYERTSPIDFIFVTHNDFEAMEYKVLKETVDGVYTSDHYAVMSKILQN